VQSIIEIEKRKFRVDFEINAWNMDTRNSENLVIEVDGHDFHEKTKEQAGRDKHRDRLLQKAGYKILRFTGSEVYNDPSAVVKEICLHF
jgi:very-short-patch-repair endonuclease